jgi:microcystin-dependent protein
MSNTHDYDIANAVGATFRADLNTCLGDIQSLNSGSSDPGTTVAYKIWADTANNLLKIRNSSNNGWLTLGDLTDANNLGLATKASPTFSGTVTSAGDLILTGTGSLQLPSGTTAQRPTPATGDIRFNTSLTQFEGYNGSGWGEIANGVPAGSVFTFATTTPPSGYLECNGAAVSRSTYASLFSSISTTWGTGDGSSTFNLPDLRGQFVRGWDNSAGVDSGRSFASSQTDQNKQHTHSVTDPGHFHTTNVDNSNLFPANGGVTIGFGGAGGYPATNFGQMSTTTTGISLANQGGTEVRVKNYALMYVIKF